MIQYYLSGMLGGALILYAGIKAGKNMAEKTPRTILEVIRDVLTTDKSNDYKVRNALFWVNYALNTKKGTDKLVDTPEEAIVLDNILDGESITKE